MVSHPTDVTGVETVLKNQLDLSNLCARGRLAIPTIGEKLQAYMQFTANTPRSFPLPGGGFVYPHQSMISDLTVFWSLQCEFFESIKATNDKSMKQLEIAKFNTFMIDNPLLNSALTPFFSTHPDAGHQNAQNRILERRWQQQICKRYSGGSLLLPTFFEKWIFAFSLALRGFIGNRLLEKTRLGSCRGGSETNSVRFKRSESAGE